MARPKRPKSQPLTTPINRDERTTAAVLAFFPVQPAVAVFPSRQAHRTLGSRTVVAPLRTSHPSGSKPSRLATLWAPGCVCSPKKPPLFPTASNPRSRSCRPHGSMASPELVAQRLRCKPLWLMVRAQRTPQLGPDRLRRAIRSRDFANPKVTLLQPSH